MNIDLLALMLFALLWNKDIRGCLRSIKYLLIHPNHCPNSTNDRPNSRNDRPNSTNDRPYSINDRPTIARIQ
nr:hypothetical protein [Nostoc sp. DedQUE02]